MSKSDSLSLAEFDAFVARLRSTISQAEEGAAIRDAVAHIFKGAAPAKAAPAAARPAIASGGKRRGRPPGSKNKKKVAAPAAKPARKGGKIDPAAILSKISAAANGVQIADLITALGSSRPRVQAALKALRGEGKIALVGAKRTARWVMAGKK